MVTEKTFRNTSASARYSKIGLWGSSSPTAPWVYRSAKRNNSQPKSQKTVASNKQNLENVVYITKAGKKYHRKSCSTVKKLAGSLPESEAAAKGYGACKVCKP